MVLRKEIIIAELEGEYVAVASEEARDYFHGMIKLNETGAFITKCMKTPTTVDEIVKKVCLEYSVTEDKAISDVKKLYSAYKNAGLILE